MNGRVWTISNLLSFIRVALVVPTAILLSSGEIQNRMYAVLVIVIGGLTDLFDGMIARKLNQVTELGKIIDPLADKIAVGVLCVILTMQQRIPFWFLAAVLGRDVIIFFGGLYVKRRKHIILQSNVTGKWAVTVIALFLIVAIMDIPDLELMKTLLMYASLAMLALSSVLYAKRFVEVLSAS